MTFSWQTSALLGSMLCLLFSFCRSLLTLSAGRLHLSPHPLASLGSAFTLLTLWLWARGQELGACPLTSFYEVLIFLSWSILLITLIVGPAYRLSLMGVFTAPLVLLLLTGALCFATKTPSPILRAHPGIVEFHAALSLIAYGAFGLAGISGVMYLVQERQLKTRRASRLLYHLPPIHDLAIANVRLLALGLGTLSIASLSGLLSTEPVAALKLWGSLILWMFYAALLAMQKIRPLAPHRMAFFSAGLFLIALLMLPGIAYLSTPLR